MLTWDHNILFKPQKAYRVRWNMNTDTPLPQEEPGGQNPPDGAIIDYYLEHPAQLIQLDILNQQSEVIRHYSNQDTLYKIPKVNIPLYWIRPQNILSGKSGAHRFLWDMHYQPRNVSPSYPIAAIYNNTAPDESSPWVMPGDYTVRLTVDGKVLTQKINVVMDPRVKTSLKDLQKQHDLSLICYKNTLTCQNILKQGKLESKIDNQLNQFIGDFTRFQNVLQDCDLIPTQHVIDAVKKTDLEFQKFRMANQK